MPNYDKMSLVTKSLSGKEIDRNLLRTELTEVQDYLTTIDDLTEDQLMLSPPNLFGFSLADKQWRESQRPTCAVSFAKNKQILHSRI